MSNHIEHIEIKNFKSIRHLKIEDCRRINVFIGYPNVGKSAILEALSSLSYLQNDFEVPFSDLCRIGNSSELFFNSNIKDDIVINCYNNQSVEIHYGNEKWFVLKIKSNLGLNKSTVDIDAIDFNNSGQRKFSISGIREHNIRFNNDMIVRKYSFGNVLNDIKTNGLVLFSPFGQNLVDIIQHNKVLRKEVIELFKFYGLNVNIDSKDNSLNAIKELEEGFTLSIPFSQMADTLQRLIFHKAAILSNTDSVLLFEEPEAHMFPPYIRMFTGDIINNKENNNQYFISTHSPFVLDDLLEHAQDDLAVYLVGLKNGETIVKRLPDEELSKILKFHVDLFFNIESYFD